MKKILIYILAFLVANTSFAQEKITSEETMKTILNDAKENFKNIIGEVAMDDESTNSIYYKSKVNFGNGASEAIVKNKTSGKYQYMCLYKEDAALIPALKAQIGWQTVMQEWGKTDNFKFERQQMDDGFIATLKDKNGTVVAEINTTKKQKLLIINSY